LKAAKVGRRKYRRATMDEKLLQEDKAAVNYEGQVKPIRSVRNLVIKL
jgi:hypothetical protein